MFQAARARSSHVAVANDNVEVVVGTVEIGRAEKEGAESCLDALPVGVEDLFLEGPSRYSLRGPALGQPWVGPDELSLDWQEGRDDIARLPRSRHGRAPETNVRLGSGEDLAEALTGHARLRTAQHRQLPELILLVVFVVLAVSNENDVARWRLGAMLAGLQKWRRPTRASPCLAR